MNIIVETAYELTPQNIDEVARTLRGDSPHLEKPAELPAVATSKPGVTLQMRLALPDSILIKLRQLLDAHPGDTAVYFQVEDVNGPRRIKTSSKISMDDLLEKELETLLGPDSVRFFGSV